MRDELSRRRRALDWLVLVGSSVCATLAVLGLVLHRTVGNLIDSLLQERGLPTILVLVAVLVGLVAVLGAVHVFAARGGGASDR